MHMGDGGVACVHLQHVMDGFSAAEKLYGGNNGVRFNLMSFKLENNQTKLEKEVLFCETEEELATRESDRVAGLAGQSGTSLLELQAEDVEEGELGTLKWPAGDAYRCDVLKNEHVIRESKEEESDKDSGGGKVEEKVSSGCGNLHDKISLCKIIDGQGKNIECSSDHADGGSQNDERAYRRDRFSSNRSRHHTPDSEERGLKYQAGHYDHKHSKSRRLSNDNGGVYTGRHSRHSEESYAKSSPSRYSSYERYSSRHRNSFSFSKASHGKHGSSFSHHSPRRHRSPVRRPRSPYDHTYHYDRKTQARHRNRREYSPSRSPYDSSRRSRAGDKRCNASGKMHVEKPGQKDSMEDRFKHLGSSSKILVNDFRRRKHLFDAGPINGTATPNQDMGKCDVAVQFGGASEEQRSMEEDMDICNTPPHVSRALDSDSGKWFYLDHHGVECGPCKLLDLKNLVKDGVLVSDHLVKHVDSDRWATVENAVSPSLTVVSDSTTQVVIPPEAPGNHLSDAEDASEPGSFCHLVGVEAADSQDVPVMQGDESATVILEDLFIDERVEALLKFHSVLPGMELETLEETLAMKFDDAGFQEIWRSFEGLTWHDAHTGQLEQNANNISHHSENAVKVSDEHGLMTYDDKQCLRAPGENDEWLNSLWPCKGGDWIRGDEIMPDKCGRKKLVLNHGFPLCQMPKSLDRDPRRRHKDDLYNQSYNRKLHLPSWAFCCADENNGLDGISKSAQAKPFTVRGGRGSPLSVIKINARVTKDSASFVFEPSTNEQYVSKPARSSSPGASDGCRSSKKAFSSSSSKNEQDLHKFPTSISIPKDHVCTAEELQLHLGDWYYIDGMGHECGPFAFPDVHSLVDHGFIPTNSSVFRKYDKVWVPTSTVVNNAHSEFKIEYGNPGESGDSSLFHSMHPQFVGFMRGKLHELVVKSYRSREFAAAINEVLDPWTDAKQPKKEMEKHLFNAGITSMSHFKKTDVDFNEGIFVGGIDDDNDLNGPVILKDEFTFDDLCADVGFCNGYLADSDPMRWTWGLLDGVILARIFHFLRYELKSLIFASLTCKHWKDAVRYYKDVCRKVDLSSFGPSCSDSMVQSILDGYNKEKITSVVLAGCTSLSSRVLEEILGSFKSLSSVDIRYCIQLADLPCRYPNVNWIKGYSLRCVQALDETNTKMRSLKQINEYSLPFRKTSRASVSDDFNELKVYFESVDKRDAAKQMFRQNLYKRSKLFDARNSSSILSRDARIRRWAMNKSDNGYNRMEGFLAFSLKSIMRENSFDFFKPKVAEIEERMKNGYYARRGLKYVREDISCMCKEAIKDKYHENDGNMNHIITLFVDLAIRLEENFKSNAREVSTEFSLKYKKIDTLSADRKCFINGGSDSRVYISGREVRRKLSELNKRLYGSGSELSDDLHGWFGDSESESDIIGSDRESDLDVKEEIAVLDGGLDSLMGDREWGARMTEVSLVPPLTRKYEVIHEYVIVVDEDDVRRKMQVSLPEDYLEKLKMQKSGIEESEDMEIPEVKDFKPRKKLGDEVIEQEVYGIDPYTHNLLLDSMPDDQEWPLFEKHLFIEDVLLRTLNRQVLNFTGTGHPPMTYPLRHAVEEIQRNSEEDRDKRTTNMCLGLLESMDCRSNDKYVAYRKGLGVVCNKNGGFSEDDFVVEFLGEVYPAWKWFEKQDGIRSLQKDSNDPAPEFYNIYLERPKGDADGYDLVVVDAMHKANYASRICHSCRPNCEAKVTAVNGQYQIGIYTVRHIQYGEEITFDYNSVTESKEEYEASVCLCGSRVCRGSYLNLTGEGAFLKVLKERHGLLDRIQLMVEACEVPLVSDGDYIDLGKAGLGSCLLGGLPDWLVAYSARVVRFINLERLKLPDEILRYNLEEKRKFFSDICIEVETSDAQVQAEGVFNQRLQNLALTLDKVSYVMKCVFGDAKKAPPPLERISGKDMTRLLWEGEESIVDEIFACIAPHTDDVSLEALKAKIHAHDPSNSEDMHIELKKSLLWLRDEVRNLPCTHKCRHDAAADMIHIYAHTKSFFRVREYKSVTSPPVFISPLDLGPNYCDKIGPGLHEYQKTYGGNYCLGQLMYWYNQTSMDPDLSLTKASRGCLVLPEMSSFYTKVDYPLRRLVYGPRIVRSMLGRMEKQPQRPWPEDGIWTFHNDLRVIGTPMLDAVLRNRELDRDMVQWLRTRPVVFNTCWDQ